MDQSWARRAMVEDGVDDAIVAADAASGDPSSSVSRLCPLDLLKHDIVAVQPALQQRSKSREIAQPAHCTATSNSDFSTRFVTRNSSRIHTSIFLCSNT